MGTYRTIPEMLLNHASQHLNARAVNDRVDGVWRSLHIHDVANRVRMLAAALNKDIPKQGESIGILSAPSSKWLIADMAIMLSGGVSVPFFTDFSASHFRHKIADSAIGTIFVFGAECWERFLPFRGMFERVVTDQIVEGFSNVVHIDHMYDTGRLRMEVEPDLIGELLARIDEHETAVVIYTSGSTGMPKGVELTHANLVSQLRDIEYLFPVKPCVDRALSLLPVAHAFERLVVYLYLARGVGIYFADDVHQLGVLMRDVRPAMITVVPRVLEKIHARMREGAEHRNIVARQLFKHADRTYGEDKRSSMIDRIADRIIGRKMEKALGGALKAVVSGGAHMPLELNRFFVRLGIPLYEGYGLTEAAPVISTNYPGHRKVGTVGCPLHSVQVSIVPDGEVLARGTNIMRGYRNRPEETAKAIDADGWLHTGDIGTVDGEGYLTIVARQKEMFKTSTGEIVIPGPIEQALCRCRWIEAACVVAEGRKHTACLLFMDPSAGKADLKIKREVQAHIQQVNKDLDHWEAIHAFALLETPPSIENDELTPTMKIRRHVIEEHYHAVVEKLYAGNERDMEETDEVQIGYC